MKIAEVRQAFLNYFAAQGHEVVPSSSLVPGNDPTLLFTNAGMVQFKDVFLGSDKRPYSRAASSQRCVRAGGKHNDLENVGYTARHLTFFEMLGNFSFGDYFKQDAIRYGWELLTDVFKLPADRLYVTVYAEDDEAFAVWTKEIGLAPERVIRIGDNKGSRYASDNFWMMGDTGPCGPCTEIFYDHGPEIAGGLPGTPEEDGDRYIEVWNIVFMQFNRDAQGEMHALPKPSVDTGMGLERIAAVLQGVHSNYEIDLFQNLIAAAARLTGTADLANQSLRVIADHIRSCCFLVLDGVLPSNEGRGYVLRRIIRRALRHGQKLGKTEPFFSELVDTLVAEMGDAYPDLLKNQKQVKTVLAGEEEQFARTLDKGMAVLEEEIADLKSGILSGELIFKLYDTYGFPVDLTNDIARERELALDLDGYENCMEQQRQRARAASQFGATALPQLGDVPATRFAGYDSDAAEGTVLELIAGDKTTEELAEGDEGMIVLDQTAFYAESGGQVGDCGYLENDQFKFEVVDCKKQGKVHLHVGKVLSGRVRVSDRVNGRIDRDVRQAIVLNHSATHLLHAALREVLGDHVSQQGSLVDSEKTRFDFSHPEPVKPEQLVQIEELVNAQIRLNTEATVELMAIDDAREKGAMMLFGEKYGDEVRVLSMGHGFSVELCGGTHVQRTGDIGLFKIVTETGIASGVRRIEAITGKSALAYLTGLEQRQRELAQVLRTEPKDLIGRASTLVKQNRELAKDLEQAMVKLASNSGGDISTEAKEVNGVKFLVKRMDGVDAKSLRDLVDQLRQKLGSSVVLLAAVNDGKIALTAGVSKDMTDRYPASKIVSDVAVKIGGKGGGRPDMAQGGGTDVDALDSALKSLADSFAI